MIAAGNDFHDLSKHDSYLKQFAAIPEISSRLLIVVNVLYHSWYKARKLWCYSNIPGEDLKDLTVCAFGTNVMSAYANEGADLFKSGDGTSRSAPRVSGLCLLIHQQHPEWSAAQIVKHVKDTATDLKEPERFGRGLVDFRRALGI